MARIDQTPFEAEITGPSAVKLTTANVAALTLTMPSGLCPLADDHLPMITIDGRKLTGAPVMSDRSWETHLRKTNGRWAVGAAIDDGSSLRRCIAHCGTGILYNGATLNSPVAKTDLPSVV